MRQVIWQQARTAVGPARRQVLGLPAAPFWGRCQARPLAHTPVLYGFSPAVIARPADWAAHIHVTGYWFTKATDDPDWASPPADQAFLQQGPPPICIGFGSLSMRRPEETTQLLLQSLAQTGQRAVLLSGWNSLAAEHLPPNVLVVEAIPHDWLFQQVAAVVHHGGAGTTAAGLRAGVPSIIIPFFADQPVWGQRVADLAVAPSRLIKFGIPSVSARAGRRWIVGGRPQRPALAKQVGQV